MKFILLNIVLLSSLFSYDYAITCIGEQSSINIQGLDYSFSGEWANETEFYGELDNCNGSLPYWTAESPVCGGAGVDNIINYANRPACDAASYKFTVGVADGFPIHIFNATTSQYENATIMINGLPCIPATETRFTLAIYDWNTNADVGFVTPEITNIWDTQIIPVTTALADTQRSICIPVDPNAPIDYTPLLQEIITNTAPNITTSNKLTNIDNRQQALDTDLNNATTGKTVETITDGTSDMNSFTTTFETTLTDSFDTYTDVFGFGGYGTAPAPVSFIMFNKTYEVFNIASIGTSNIEMIRNTFLLFAYLFGFIIIFRTT